MPIQAPMQARSVRTVRRQYPARRVNFPTVGQCFEIEVSRELDGWSIRIPEIGAVAHASRRATVELAARECISAQTGIPIGYVAILIRD
jgi:hypothetical protein